MRLGVCPNVDAETNDGRIEMELSQKREPRKKIERGRVIKAPSSSNLVD